MPHFLELLGKLPPTDLLPYIPGNLLDFWANIGNGSGREKNIWFRGQMEVTNF
jgi:hypothetical protein